MYLHSASGQCVSLSSAVVCRGPVQRGFETVTFCVQHHSLAQLKRLLGKWIVFTLWLSGNDFCRDDSCRKRRNKTRYQQIKGSFAVNPMHAATGTVLIPHTVCTAAGTENMYDRSKQYRWLHTQRGIKH